MTQIEVIQKTAEDAPSEVQIREFCEFCEEPYDESKTDKCFLCQCGREGRSHPDTKTLRETNSNLKSVGLTENIKEVK